MYKLLTTLVPPMLLYHCACLVMCRSALSDSSLRTTTFIPPTSNADVVPTGQTTWLTTTTLSPDEFETQRESRAMTQDYDDHDDLQAESEEMMASDKSSAQLSEQAEGKAVKTDPWYGYYDFLINEGSFKFWAVFQLATAALLIYSSFAAVYYAKFNPLSSDYDYYGDDFFRRRSFTSRSTRSIPGSGMDGQTFQRIIDAISLKKFS